MTPKIPQQHDPLGNFYEHEQIQVLKVCELDGLNGLVTCSFLSLALLLLRRVMAKIAVAGTATGCEYEGRLTVACPVCRRQRSWSTRFASLVHVALLWKNLRPLQVGDTSITWRTEVRPIGTRSDIAFGPLPGDNTSITTLVGMQSDFGEISEDKLPWK